MKFSLLLGLGLALSTPRQAAALPPAGQAPVSSLPMGKNEELKGSITLPNHNTALFIADFKTNKVRVVTVLPTGAPAWEATLAKAQQIRTEGLYGTSLMSTGVSTLMPLFLTSAGNTIFSVESVTDAPASSGLPRYALLVQALSATGQAANRIFTVPAPPEKSERLAITTFADEEAVYALVRESNLREKSSQLFLDRCDLRTGKATHTALALPAPAPVRHADDFMLDWVFGGYRAGTLYFYRALKGFDAKTNARGVPVEFEVKTLTPDGQATGGFVTSLHRYLPPKSFVQGNTWFPHLGLARAPGSLGTTDKSGNAYGSFSISTGGDCEFFLDEATGDCLFAGQYTNEIYTPQASDLPSLGTFVQRYTPTGTVVKTAIAPYATIPKFDQDLLATKAYVGLDAMLARSPLDQSLTFQFFTKEGYVVSAFDAQLAPAPRQLVPLVGNKNESFSKVVYWSGSTCLQSLNQTTGHAQADLSVDALCASPSPLYHRIGELVQAQYTNYKGPRSENRHHNIASFTGPSSALVFVTQYDAGTPISVFEVK